MKKRKQKLSAVLLDTDPCYSIAHQAAFDVVDCFEEKGPSANDWRNAFYKVLTNKEKLDSLNILAHQEADNDCIAEEVAPVELAEPLLVLKDTFMFDAEDAGGFTDIDDAAEAIIRGALRATYFSKALEG